MRDFLQFKSPFLFSKKKCCTSETTYSKSSHFIFSSKHLLLLLFMFIGFTSSGQLRQEWLESYNMSGSNYDRGLQVAIDEEQNAVVAGIYGSPAIPNITVKKVSPEGEKLWEKQYSDTFHRQSQLVSLALDKEDNIYVLGYTTANQYDGNVLLIKYSPDGEQVWTKLYGGGGIGYDRPSAMAMDAEGNLYVTARFSVDKATTPLVLMKVNPANGEEVWVKEYEEPAQSEFSSVVADNMGHIYVAGKQQSENRGEDALLLKYDATTGEQLFSHTYDYLTGGEQVEEVFYASGNVYMAGTQRAGGFEFLFAWSVSDTGKLMWQLPVNNEDNVNILYSDATVDQGNNLIMTGTYRRGRTDSGFFTTKLNPSGSIQWRKVHERGVDSADIPHAVAVNDEGHIAVTGFTRVDPTIPTVDIHHMMTLLYDANGNRLSEEIVDPESATNSAGNYVAFDASNNIYVTGTTEVPDLISLSLIKYSIDKPETPVTIDVKLSLPPYAMKVGEQVRTTAYLGELVLEEDTGVRWDWGDAETSVSYTAFGTNRITGEHRYKEAGIYNVGLDFENSNLQPASDDYKQWMVIFDPKASSVLGAGLMSSPRTPLALIGEEGTVAYTFLLDYQEEQHDAKPSGALVLAFKNQNIFWSTSQQWLVVRGNQAVWHGMGKLNGKGRYGYTAAAADGGGNGLNDPNDQLRIQIWDMDAGNRIVYDNFNIEADIMDLSQQAPHISFGQVIIGDLNAPTNLFAFNPGTVLEDKMMVEAYPTKFQDKATLNFTLMNGGAYTIFIHDMQGKVVQEVQQGDALPLHPYSVTINGSGLAKGMYIARVVTNEGSKTVKLIVEK